MQESRETSPISLRRERLEAQGVERTNPKLGSNINGIPFTYPPLSQTALSSKHLCRNEEAGCVTCSILFVNTKTTGDEERRAACEEHVFPNAVLFFFVFAMPFIFLLLSFDIPFFS
jgi:hypothetical protein